MEDQRRGVDQVDQESAEGFVELLQRQRLWRRGKGVNELDVLANPRRELLELPLAHLSLRIDLMVMVLPEAQRLGRATATL